LFSAEELRLAYYRSHPQSQGRPLGRGEEEEEKEEEEKDEEKEEEKDEEQGGGGQRARSISDTY